MIRWEVLSTAPIAAEVVAAARDTERARFVAVGVVARAAATGRPVES